MPIQFPQPQRGNPFDRWKVMDYAAAPQPPRRPNLGRVGSVFNSDTLKPGFGRGVRVPVNLQNLGKPYQHGDKSGARPNPAACLAAADQIQDTGAGRPFRRMLAQTAVRVSGMFVAAARRFAHIVVR